MSKEKNTKKPAASKGPSKVALFLRDDRTRFIAGLLMMLVGAWLAIAFASFLSTDAGKADLTLHGEAPAGSSSNWTGDWGHLLAKLLINDWLGLGSIFFVVLLIRIGYTLMRNNPLRPLLGVVIRYSLWSIWVSMFFGIIFVNRYKDSYLFLGGEHGYAMDRCLENLIGYPGALLLLLVSLLILCVFTTRTTIDRTRSAFDFFKRFKFHRAAPAEAADSEGEEVETAGEQPSDLDAADSDPFSDGSNSESQTDDVPTEPIDVNPIDAPQDVAGTIVDDPIIILPPEEEKGAADDLPIIETTPEDNAGDDLPSIETISEDEPIVSPNGVILTDDPGFTVTTNKTDVVEEPYEQSKEDYDPTKDLEFYQFPTFNLLKEYNAATPVDMVEQNENKEKIRQTLLDYGIEIQNISATVGPTITLFEIVLAQGTKINRVKSLSDEIAMSIASRAGIRIIAPIPGKSAIGIEVPNKDPQTVSMRECIQSRAFQESKYNLPVALGKTITNEVFTFDLCKAPHMLVAGATGQGKSVGLNAIITSLLYKKHPSQLKIVLVDPKMVEFSIYSRIDRHFLAKLPDAEDPIITDVSKVVQTLKSLCAEMEDRYALLRDAGCRKLEEYNEKFIHRELNPRKHIDAPLGSKEGTNHHFLPYIVAIVDEYGDLIMTAGKEVELPIARIAQKARAVGIHMIIATQRPSAKIVTGIIKANFPARIAFRVSSSIDSSIILDQPGAQNLIGRGDLLVSLGDKFERVQCAFVDTPEVDRVNKFIADQQAYPHCYILPDPKPEPGEGGGDEGSSSSVDLHQLDPLFDECAELVVSSGQGSTSMIQRKFGIGYNRAGRIMDQLEAAGFVGPYQGSKARAVLVDSVTEMQNILDSLKNA